MHEFIAKKGFISQGNAQVSGTLTVTNGITGSLCGTASYAVSSSYIDPTIFNSLTLPLEFTFKNTATATDPGKGNFQFDSLVTSSITNVYIDQITNGGLDISNIIQKLSSGSFNIYIQQKTDATNAGMFSVNGAVIDNNGWFTIPVSPISFASNGIPSNNQLCTIVLINTTTIAPGNTYEITSSWSNNSQTASYFITSSVTSASYAPQAQDILINSITASIISSSVIYTNSPAYANQVATKQYVDNFSPFGYKYYFRSSSADVPNYLAMYRVDVPFTSSATITINNISSSQYISAWISPVAGINRITMGTVEIRYDAYLNVGGNKAVSILSELYLYSASVEVLIGSSNSMTVLSSTQNSYIDTIVIPISKNINITDRFVCKLKATNVIGSNVNLSIVIDDDTGAGLVVPLAPSNFVLKSGDIMQGALINSYGFVGPLNGTASNANSSSYSISASYLSGSGNAVIGGNIVNVGTVTPSYSNFVGINAGNGATNANNSNFFGIGAGSGSTNAHHSNFFGNYAGNSTTNAYKSNFFGPSAGSNATNAYCSNFFGNYAGIGATNAYDSNFFGNNAGNYATNANYSNFFGKSAGNYAINAANSNFFGKNAGVGAVSASNSNFFGTNAGQAATNAYNSNFFGHNAGNAAVIAHNSNFFGQSAGDGASNAHHSNFFGDYTGNGATNANYSNFFGTRAGQNATNAHHSNFQGYNAGVGAINAYKSNFQGYNAGENATNANYSNFFGHNVGNGATNANNAIFIGYQSGLNDTVNNSGGKSSILIGDYTSTGGNSDSIAIGKGTMSPNSGSLNIGNVIYATNIYSGSISSSTPQVSSKVGIGTTTPNNKLDVVGNISCSVITASLFYGTSSYALTASYAMAGGGGTTLATGSTYPITTSWAQNAINATTSDTASYVTASNIFGAVTIAQTAYIANAINFVPVTSVSASWVSASTFITTAQTASYVTSSNVIGKISSALTADTASSISFVPIAATSASWVSASAFITTAQTASYVYASNITGVISASISASWASSSISSSYASTASRAITASYTLGMPTIKAGILSASAFSGSPYSASVTFANPFPNTIYSVVITGEANRTFTVAQKSGSRFIINSNSSTPMTGSTYWQAMSIGEFYS